MAPPTQVSRNDHFARGNLVTVTLDGNLVQSGLIFADSVAGVVQQELSVEEAKALSIPAASQTPLLGRNRVRVTRTGTVVITVKSFTDENFVPSVDGNAPWPERVRPYKTPVSPGVGAEGSSPWATY